LPLAGVTPITLPVAAAPAGQPDLAFAQALDGVVAGYCNVAQLQADTDLLQHAALRYFSRSCQLAAHPEPVPTDPAKALLAFWADIDRFWKAYDHAQRQPDRAS
jgi:hypothetical protein